jgi:hypothetical protein
VGFQKEHSGISPQNHVFSFLEKKNSPDGWTPLLRQSHWKRTKARSSGPGYYWMAFGILWMAELNLGTRGQPAGLGHLHLIPGLSRDP